MIKIDGSLFVQIVNFIVLIWALNTVLYKPIRGILAKRKDTVTGLEGDIDRCNSEAVAKGEAFTLGVKNARAEGLKKKNEMIDAAVEEEQALIRNINAKAQAELARVREKIAKDTDSVRESLEKDIEVFSKAIGEKILGRAF